MPDYLFVDHPDSISQDITGHARLGVDTEFMREKTYFAQLCLIQISTPDAIFCVDPLVDHSQSEFWAQLLTCSWVVHSARQDIEVVYQTAGQMPHEIFDTQVAAGLLGMPAQMGYAGLVKELFDVDMAKSHTRADWTRRPLAEAVLDYAAEDVEYLLPAADILSEKLDKKGRLDWALQDSALLLDKALYEISGDQAVDRLDETVENRGRANVFTRPAQRIGLVDERSDDKVAAHFVDHRGTALTEFAVQRRARAQTQLTKRLPYLPKRA